jgi:ribonuclease HII
MSIKQDINSAIIVEDSDSESDSGIEQILEIKKNTKVQKISKPKKYIEPLKKFFKNDENLVEIGVDEAGRGPLFGRVYTAAVILPKDDSFDHSKVKDSKKFTSKKKIQEVAEYIKENALAWYVSFEDETVIDTINILQATQKSMHHSIIETRKQYIRNLKENGKYELQRESNFHLLIDGNYFNPITYLNKGSGKLETIPFDTIEGGDNKYTSIASASILAKVERDKYIEDLCNSNPDLIEKYGIDSNKGYGAKKHIDGIKEYGITIWHRKTFGICKSFT